MKQIIPFKKELLFKTKVSEITSISLEHTLSLKQDDLISGEFVINGDYKMTEGSINREKFQFKLPFDITLDSRYDIGTIVIDIDNFYYEIINSEALQVNIDVYIEGEKITEEEKNDIVPEPSLIKEETKEVLLDEQDIRTTPKENEKKETLIDEYTPAIEQKKAEPIILNIEKENEVTINQGFNLFENIDNSDTYITYYVYIVKEEDTLDKILTKYNVTREDISHYNNLDNFTAGTKLIIPSYNNE